ncbi:hypothetical protein [Mucilaginibacter sp. R-33]|uniref:hypothetical protein n=1 Tax=Mucilaginibacter sp. R-33 TaxID=3416711 RepID=UPI003CED2DCC
MKKIVSFAAVLSFFCQASYGQGITKTADGEGTVLFKGSSIGIDIAKTDISIGWNNLQRTVGDKSTWFLGLSAQGENKEGVSTLLSKGDAVPSASGRIYGGWSWSNATSSSHAVQEQFILNRMTRYDQRFLRNYRVRIYEAALALCDESDPDQAKFKKGFLNVLRKADITVSITDALVINPATDKSSVQTIKKQLTAVSDKMLAQYKTDLAGFNAELKKLSDAGPKTYTQFLVYGFGDYSSSQFKQMTKLDSVNYNNSFQNVNQRGDKIGLGVNYQNGPFTFGLTYDYAFANNFDLLSKKTYTFKKVLTSGNQSLTEQKDITAYSGTYGTLHMDEIGFDALYNVKLDPLATNHLLFDPYARWKVSHDKALMPNTFDVGCGFYFFQQTGKFLGGFYVELPDVNNNYEKMKPDAEQVFRKPLQRLSFGIVGKLSLSTFAGLF